MEASIYLRRLSHLHELRFQRESRSVQRLCTDAVGATRAPVRKDSLPPHSFQHIGGVFGFPLPMQQPARDRRSGRSLAEVHYSTPGRRTGSGSTVSPVRRQRTAERNPFVPEAASKVCKPSVYDCISLDWGRQVLPISPRS